MNKLCLYGAHTRRMARVEGIVEDERDGGAVNTIEAPSVTDATIFARGTPGEMDRSRARSTSVARSWPRGAG
jgi:hypothetical protein